MRNHEVTTAHDLLKPDGTLVEPGWSRSLIQNYNRESIKANKLLIKEWDYYLILAKDYAVALTISDDGYVGLESVSLLDFKKSWEHTETVLFPFPAGKFNLPRSSKSGNTVFHKPGKLDMEFIVTEGKRRLICDMKDFMHDKSGRSFTCDITLEEPPMDSMVIATPWEEKPTRFYYNQKINCMRASGKATFDGVDYVFNPETDFGTLDWGRGVWTYQNTWYWGSGNAVVNGKPFGFNIGYGFTDRSYASENIIFYDGKAHKIDDISFNIPADSFMKPWTFTSSDGRFEMDFEPVLDRNALLDFKLIVSDQHQVFGKMTGKAILDDGTVLEIKDVMCFAEKVMMKY